MKKFAIVFGLFFSFTVQAVSGGETNVQPNLEVLLSPGNLPTQRIDPGTRGVEVLRIWLAASDHPNNGALIKKLKFKRTGEGNRNDILRYYLMQGNKILGKISLPSSDLLEFKNLSLFVPDGKTMELRILVDVSVGDVSGMHQFEISEPDFLTIEKNDIRDPETWVFGDFPVRANKLLIGSHQEAPDDECNMREEPVCGVDGKTYFNRCITFQKGVEVGHEGACPYVAPKIIAPCPENYEPVCGDNGITYDNMCFLEYRNISKNYDGECFPSDYEDPETFAEAVDLLKLKINQLLQVRPRIEAEPTEKLHIIQNVLYGYRFTPGPQELLLPRIVDFLRFTENPSDREVLYQAIENFRLSVVEYRAMSARQKYGDDLIPFIDVDENEWYMEPVSFLKKKEWVSGYEDFDGNQTGLFNPDHPVTKAEITKMVLMASGLWDIWSAEIPAMEDESYAVNHWGHDYIALGKSFGLSMWADNPNPDKKASRGEVIRLLFEVFMVEPPTNFPSDYFPDVNELSENYPYIQEAKELDIISGYPDGTFREDDSILRAEMAKVLEKAYELWE